VVASKGNAVLKKAAGFTYELKCGCGDLFVTCNDDKAGNLKQIFLKLGKAGGCSNAVMTSTGMLLSTALKNNVPPEDLIRVLDGTGCHMELDGTGCHMEPSCMSQVAKALKAHLEGKRESL